jgi:hydrogenase expression/formation protein HypC
MCLGIPGLVVEMSTQHPDLARVDVEGVVRDINMALLDDDPAVPGDWILIHLGFALQKMTEAEVQDARSTLAVLGEGGLGEDPFAGFSFDSGPDIPELRGDRRA